MWVGIHLLKLHTRVTISINMCHLKSFENIGGSNFRNAVRYAGPLNSKAERGLVVRVPVLLIWDRFPL